MDGVERGCAGPGPGRGLLLFITVDLGIDQARAVIDRGMQERVTGPGTGLASSVSTEGAVATTVGDPTDLFHIDLNELTRSVSFVADVLGPANTDSGVQIDVSEQRDAISGEDLRCRRLRNTQVVGDAVSIPPARDTQPDHAPLQTLRRTIRRRVRARGTIPHRYPAADTVTGRPLRYRAPRDLETLRDARLGLSPLHDEASDLQSAFRRDSSAGVGSVGHEDLLVVV